MKWRECLVKYDLTTKIKTKQKSGYQIFHLFFPTQISNFNQFRHGEVWWKFWTQSQDMITLLYLCWARLGPPSIFISFEWESNLWKFGWKKSLSTKSSIICFNWLVSKKIKDILLKTLDGIFHVYEFFSRGRSFCLKKSGKLTIEINWCNDKVAWSTYYETFHNNEKPCLLIFWSLIFDQLLIWHPGW